MVDKSSKGTEHMSDVSSASFAEWVEEVAGPPQWGDNKKSLFDRAAKAAGISYRLARSLYYDEITDRNHKAARLMRDAVERRRHEAAERSAVERAKQAAAELAHQYENIASALNASDQDSYRHHIASLLNVARALSGLGHAQRSEAATANDE